MNVAARAEVTGRQPEHQNQVKVFLKPYHTGGWRSVCKWTDAFWGLSLSIELTEVSAPDSDH